MSDHRSRDFRGVPSSSVRLRSDPPQSAAKSKLASTHLSPAWSISKITTKIVPSRLKCRICENVRHRLVATRIQRCKEYAVVNWAWRISVQRNTRELITAKFSLFRMIKRLCFEIWQNKVQILTYEVSKNHGSILDQHSLKCEQQISLKQKRIDRHRLKTLVHAWLRYSSSRNVLRQISSRAYERGIRQTKLKSIFLWHELTQERKWVQRQLWRLAHRSRDKFLAMALTNWEEHMTKFGARKLDSRDPTISAAGESNNLGAVLSIAEIPEQLSARSKQSIETPSPTTGKCHNLSFRGRIRIFHFWRDSVRTARLIRRCTAVQARTRNLTSLARVVGAWAVWVSARLDLCRAWTGITAPARTLDVRYYLMIWRLTLDLVRGRRQTAHQYLRCLDLMDTTLVEAWRVWLMRHGMQQLNEMCLQRCLARRGNRVATKILWNWKCLATARHRQDRSQDPVSMIAKGKFLRNRILRQWLYSAIKRRKFRAISATISERSKLILRSKVYRAWVECTDETKTVQHSLADPVQMEGNYSCEAEALIIPGHWRPAQADTSFTTEHNLERPTEPWKINWWYQDENSQDNHDSPATDLSQASSGGNLVRSPETVGFTNLSGERTTSNHLIWQNAGQDLTQLDDTNFDKPYQIALSMILVLRKYFMIWIQFEENNVHLKISSTQFILIQNRGRMSSRFIAWSNWTASRKGHSSSLAKLITKTVVRMRCDKLGEYLDKKKKFVISFFPSLWRIVHCWDIWISLTWYSRALKSKIERLLLVAKRRTLCVAIKIWKHCVFMERIVWQIQLMINREEMNIRSELDVLRLGDSQLQNYAPEYSLQDLERDGMSFQDLMKELNIPDNHYELLPSCFKLWEKENIEYKKMLDDCEVEKFNLRRELEELRSEVLLQNRKNDSINSRLFHILMNVEEGKCRRIQKIKVCQLNKILSKAVISWLESAKWSKVAGHQVKLKLLRMNFRILAVSFYFWERSSNHNSLAKKKIKTQTVFSVRHLKLKVILCWLKMYEASQVKHIRKSRKLSKLKLLSASKQLQGWKILAERGKRVRVIYISKSSKRRLIYMKNVFLVWVVISHMHSQRTRALARLRSRILLARIFLPWVRWSFVTDYSFFASKRSVLLSLRMGARLINTSFFRWRNYTLQSFELDKSTFDPFYRMRRYRLKTSWDAWNFTFLQSLGLNTTWWKAGRILRTANIKRIWTEWKQNLTHLKTIQSTLRHALERKSQQAVFKIWLRMRILMVTKSNKCRHSRAFAHSNKICIKKAYTEWANLICVGAEDRVTHWSHKIYCLSQNMRKWMLYICQQKIMKVSFSRVQRAKEKHRFSSFFHEWLSLMKTNFILKLLVSRRISKIKNRILRQVYYLWKMTFGMQSRVRRILSRFLTHRKKNVQQEVLKMMLQKVGCSSIWIPFWHNIVLRYWSYFRWIKIRNLNSELSYSHEKLDELEWTCITARRGMHPTISKHVPKHQRSKSVKMIEFTTRKGQQSLQLCCSCEARSCLSNTGNRRYLPIALAFSRWGNISLVRTRCIQNYDLLILMSTRRHILQATVLCWRVAIRSVSSKRLLCTGFHLGLINAEVRSVLSAWRLFARDRQALRLQAALVRQAATVESLLHIINIEAHLSPTLESVSEQMDVNTMELPVQYLPRG